MLSLPPSGPAFQQWPRLAHTEETHGVVEGAAQPADEFVDFLAADNERRRQHHGVGHGARDYLVLHAGIAAVQSGGPAFFELGPAGLVRGKLNARNQADALIYSTEKSLKDLGDKIDDATKSSVETAMESLKKALEGEDTQEIKRLSEELTQASHKLAEAIYQQASQADGQPDAEGTDQEAGPSAAEEDVVDADFEEIKDEDKK